MGLVTWVVDPENHDYLLPLGCIGELLLEGPLVGRGYLNDPDKTAAAFHRGPGMACYKARRVGQDGMDDSTRQATWCDTTKMEA